MGMLDLNEERGAKLEQELDGVVFCKTDVTDGTSVQAAIDKTVAKFGAISVAVNCAGMADPMKVLSKKGPMDMAKFDTIVKVNLYGTMNVIRLAAEKMIQNEANADGEKGVIVNCASVAAFEGQIGQAAYTASKAGVCAMTLPVAREFADYGIRVMTIAPGLFRTPMLSALPEEVIASIEAQIPFPKRLGKPTEFASMVREIVENPVLNGSTIRLDACIRMAAE